MSHHKTKTELKRRGPQERFWCFTWYPEFLEETKTYDLEDKPQWEEKTMGFLVFQLEICPETKRPHYQGYVEFLTKQSRKATQNIFQYEGLHLEKRLGTGEQARAYCMKPDSAVPGSGQEYGKLAPGQGKRVDIDTMGAMIRDGMTPKQVAHELPGMFIKYERGIRSLSSITAKGYSGKRLTTLLYGPSGAGKSYIANLLFEGSCWTHQGGQGSWFDGYNNERVLILSDFDIKTAHKKGWDRGFLLNLFDRGPVMLPIKCGFITSNIQIIIITTCAKPIYLLGDHLLNVPSDPEMLRRLEIIEFTSGPSSLASNLCKVQHYVDLTDDAGFEALITRWDELHPWQCVQLKASTWRKPIIIPGMQIVNAADLQVPADQHREDNIEYDITPLTLAELQVIVQDMSEYLDNDERNEASQLI